MSDPSIETPPDHFNGFIFAPTMGEGDESSGSPGRRKWS